HHARGDPEATSEESGPRGQARCVADVALREANALGRDGVDIRSGRPVVAVATEVIGARTIDIDVDDAHGRSSPPGCLARRRRGGPGQRERRPRDALQHTTEKPDAAVARTWPWRPS